MGASDGKGWRELLQSGEEEFGLAVEKIMNWLDLSKGTGYTAGVDLILVRQVRRFWEGIPEP